MKTIIVLLVTFNLFLISSAVLNAAGIRDSAHDFSKGTPLLSGEICIACHAPHHGESGGSLIPLWSHAMTTQTFTPYAYAKPDPDPESKIKAKIGQPDGLSKMCLSCHDGTVAVDSFYKEFSLPTPTILHPIGSGLLDGAAGQQHFRHPVSIVYDTALSIADDRLYDPSSLSSKTTIFGGTIDSDLLSGGKVQCTSCHDVHNRNTSAGVTVGLLKIDQARLCVTCHGNDANPMPAPSNMPPPQP